MTFLSRRDLIRYAGAGSAAVATVGLPVLTQAAQAAPASASAANSAIGVTYAQVRPKTAAQRALMAHLDDTHTTFDDGTVEVLLWEGDLAKVEEVGMDYELIAAPAQADDVRPAGLRPQPGETAGDYRKSSEQYYDELAALAEAHPDRAKLLPMGNSLLGTQVFAIEIASGVNDVGDDGRPVVMHDGMHHCREWPAGEMPIMWAYDLLENYGSDDIITDIVDNVRTIILPLVNPDGFDRTMEWAALAGTSSDRSLIGTGYPLAITGKGDMWRKNVRALSNEGPLEITGPIVGGSPVGASQPDAYGIDLNRNYPFFWGDESGSSSIPETQTYRGTAPFSEPETHNVRDLVRGNLPIMHITHHTSGEQMLIPWGREPREIRSPDWPHMAEIAREMRDGYTHDGVEYSGNGYDPIQAFNLYPTSGTSRDWGHAATRTIIYTFEHGTEFHGPYAATIPPMYAQNRGAFIRHSLAALDADVQAGIEGVGPAGGTVEISKTVDTPTNLQLSGTPVISLGGMPTVNDPTGDAIRPTSVNETLSRTVNIAADGTWSVKLPPSTRAYLINESLVGNEPGTLEPYTVTVADAAGSVLYTASVTVERGYVASGVSADNTDVHAYGQIDTDPLPGDWPIEGPA